MISADCMASASLKNLSRMVASHVSEPQAIDGTVMLDAAAQPTFFA